MSKYTNNLPITASNYADNLFKAVSEIENLGSKPTTYELEVQSFYKKGVAIHKRNRLEAQELKVNSFRRKILVKANKRIRQMINVSETELMRLQKDRKRANLQGVCDKYQVNIKTIRRIL